MLWPPADRPVVANVAWPAAFNVPVPSVAVPSLKVTVPVAVFAPDVFGATVAVNVTDWPNTGVATDGVTVVVVVVTPGGAALRVCVSAADVRPPQLGSPP